MKPRITIKKGKDLDTKELYLRKSKQDVTSAENDQID
jgi:hypothetical protein